MAAALDVPASADTALELLDLLDTELTSSAELLAVSLALLGNSATGLELLDTAPEDPPDFDPEEPPPPHPTNNKEDTKATPRAFLLIHSLTLCRIVFIVYASL